MGMSSSRDKARERRLRRLARDCELQLVRSWRLLPNRDVPTTYGLIDAVHGHLVFARPEDGLGMSLDEIEAFLQSVRPAHTGAAGEVTAKQAAPRA